MRADKTGTAGDEDPVPLAISLRHDHVGSLDEHTAGGLVGRPPLYSGERAVVCSVRNQCAPAPVSDRTSSSANLSSSFSLLVNVPMMAARKPIGIEMRPGFSSGMGAVAVQLNSAVALETCLEVAGTPHSLA